MDHSHTAIRGQLVTLITRWFAAWSGFSLKEEAPLQTKTRTVKSKPVLALQGILKWSLQKNGATSNKSGKCKKNLKRLPTKNQ